jgi:maltose O-acetyltransferase
MRTEKEKMQAGELYDPLDLELVHARDLCQDLNVTRESDQDARRAILKQLFGQGRESVWMQPPFYCDYGSNILLGEWVFFKFNCVVLDVCVCNFASGASRRLSWPAPPGTSASRPICVTC